MKIFFTLTIPDVCYSFFAIEVFITLSNKGLMTGTWLRGVSRAKRGSYRKKILLMCNQKNKVSVNHAAQGIQLFFILKYQRFKDCMIMICLYVFVCVCVCACVCMCVSFHSKDFSWLNKTFKCLPKFRSSMLYSRIFHLCVKEILKRNLQVGNSAKECYLKRVKPNEEVKI